MAFHLKRNCRKNTTEETKQFGSNQDVTQMNFVRPKSKSLKIKNKLDYSIKS